MKKVWVLERKFNEEDKELIEELKSNHPEMNIDFKEYFEVVKMANYFKFCSAVKKEFKRADEFAISNLKKKLAEENYDPAFYDDETKERFKGTHNKVRDSYRLLQGEVEDGVTDYTHYHFVKECDNIKYFLWNDKK